MTSENGDKIGCVLTALTKSIKVDFFPTKIDAFNKINKG